MAKRKEIAKSIKIAKEQGDLSENAEYSAAKAQQAENERRINWLRGVIKKAKVVEKIGKKKVDIGCFVELESLNKNAKQIIRFQIVGTHETNPSLGKISCQSPLGRALMGKTPGSEVKFETPVGEEKYKIKRIS